MSKLFKKAVAAFQGSKQYTGIDPDGANQGGPEGRGGRRGPRRGGRRLGPAKTPLSPNAQPWM